MYDFLSDFCIEKHSYILKKNNIYLELGKRAMINHTLKKIILIEDIKTNDWDY